MSHPETPVQPSVRSKSASWRRWATRLCGPVVLLSVCTVIFAVVYWLTPVRPYATLDVDKDCGFILFSPDSKTLLTAGTEDSAKKHGPLRLWDVEQGIERLSVAEGQWKAIETVLFSPDSRLFAVYETEAPKVSPDGEWLAVPVHAGARLVKVSTSEEAFDLTNKNDVDHTYWADGAVFYPSITFSPDSKLVAIGDLLRLPAPPFLNNWLPTKLNPFPYDYGGSVVRVWDVGTAKEVMAIEGASEATFSPAGTVLATLHYPQTVKLWHVPFRKARVRIFAWASPFWLVAFLVYWLIGRAWRRAKVR